MSAMKPIIAAEPERTDEHGVRRQKGTDGNDWVRVSDLSAYILSLDARYCSECTRGAVQAFQREAVLLQPAARHRLACELLKSLGAELPPELIKPPLRPV